MPENLSHEEFITFVRSALHYLYDLNQLRKNPLTQLLGIAERVDSPAALQRIMMDAIQALKPAEQEPPQSRAWRIYDALYYRYVQRFDRDVVADQLGISGRQLRREQLAALEELASYLWKKYTLDRSAEQVAAKPAVTPLRPDAELAWIKESPSSRLINLDSLIQKVLDLMEPLAQNAQAQIEYHSPPQEIHLALPEVALRNILLNLLSAVIQRAARGKISIHLSRVDYEIIVVVSSIIPESENLSTERAKASLDMANQLAALCGARLEMVHDQPGFLARLVLPVPELKQVLVVDDNADALQLFQRYATGTRYAILPVRDPAQAFQIARKTCPSAVLIDVMMPDIDGWDLLGQLRQNPSTSHLPIAVCTILPQEELARALGVNFFLQKPVSRDDFLRALDEMIGFTNN